MKLPAWVKRFEKWDRGKIFKLNEITVIVIIIVIVIGIPVINNNSDNSNKSMLIQKS